MMKPESITTEPNFGLSAVERDEGVDDEVTDNKESSAGALGVVDKSADIVERQ